MIESYIFINPLDIDAIQQTQSIIALIHEQHQPLKYHIIPVTNVPMMDDFFMQHHIKRSELVRRNQLSQLAYQLSLAFEYLASLNITAAVTFLDDAHRQGQRLTTSWIIDYLNTIGRQFTTNPYCHYKRYHNIAETKLQHNNHLLHQMGIETLPSMVIYNFKHQHDIAVKLDDLSHLSFIKTLFQSDRIQSVVAPTMHSQYH